ncbi:helicase [Massilia sp. UMI-21]|nr:helicase [Massilia sp. UMI-21]
MQFTLEDIVRQFDPTTFARGERYASEGRVIAADVFDKMITGEVEGSGYQVYRQTIFVEADRRGVVRFDSECSCPMFGHCKHVVAVLLVALQEIDPAATHGLSPAAEHWLQQFSFLQSLTRAGPPPAPKERLVYVLLPNRGEGVPRLHLCKARLRKDGSIGGATVQNDFYRLLASPPAYVQDEDEEPIRLLVGMNTGRMYQQGVKPAGRLGARLLEQLCREGRLWWSASLTDLRRGDLLQVQPGLPRHGQLGWHEDDEAEGAVSLRWCFEDGSAVGEILTTEPMHYLDGGLLGELALPEQLAALPQQVLQQLVRQAPRLAPEQRAAMTERFMALGLDRIVPPPQALQTRRRSDVLPTPCLVLDSLAMGTRGKLEWHDHAMLLFDYAGVLAPPGQGPELRRVEGGTVELIERNAQAEAAARATLAGYGFAAPEAGTVLAEFPDALVLPAEAAWVAFVRHGLARLRAAGWQVELGADFRYDLQEVQEWYAELNEDEGENAWFALELGVLVNGERHSLLPLLLEMIREAPRDFDAAALASHGDDEVLIVALPDLTRVALPWGRVKPILATLGELYFSDRIGESFRLPLMDAARLAELEQAAQLRWMGGERLRELGRKLESFGGVRPVAAPAGLQATLRPYQQAGLAWMQFLREYGFGGILADDMGLGKTIQTLAHLLVEKEAGRLDAPALVVAPTSLMGNWQAEAARFAPGLRVLLLHGKDRSAQFDQIGHADLVLTTYPLLARDEEALRRHAYHLLILDEAQYIKNSRSKAAQAARLIEARHRLCLTGTPVQNHLGELWSQFHFLMPGLLGEEKAFNTVFRKPIEQQGDSLRRDLLARRVRPFMLRRTKDKVATELPPKTEIVLPVEFGAAQRDLYETVRLAMDRKVRDEIARKGFARSQIVILDALLKLRQVCCDPRLLKTAGVAAAAASAKLGVLIELLDTLLSEQRKILVFSQFTSMLALIAEALRGRDVEFVTLTGDTEDRAAPIAAFQGGQVGVFLISLKAGGVGLNLTAADTVIHYDPWWNPASENQATDRAWRIGQEQPVFVYKLIARGTLEERIQDMQRRKGELASGLLDADGGLAPAIGADELQAVLAPLAP